MFKKFKIFTEFTTKPKIDDLICDSRRWTNKNRGGL